MSRTMLLERIEKLPARKRKIVEDLVDALAAVPEKNQAGEPQKHFTFSWAGALADLRDQYTSVELQKEILNLWMPKH